MAQSRPVTIALDGYGAEQGFDVLAEGARRAAADGIGVRVFGPQRCARPRRGRRGSRWSRPPNGSATRRTPVPVGARAQGGLGRARRRRRRRGQRRRRWSASARPGRRWRRRPSACAGSKACSGPALAVPHPVAEQTGALPRRRRQRRGPRPAPGPVRLPRRRLQRRRARRRTSPTVGLLTVGEEAGKGREEIVEAHRILAAAPGINFAGNVEGARPARRRRSTSSSPTASPATSSLKVMEGAARTLAGAISDARPLEPDGGGRRAAAETVARRRCAKSSTPTRPAARSCSGCARSRSSATAPPAPKASPTRSGSPPAASRSTRSGAPRRCCARAHAGARRAGRRRGRRVTAE